MKQSDELALDEIANVVDPVERRARVLRKLELIYQTALSRTRGGNPDPDCNGATGAMREAIPLLTIENVPRGTPTGLGEFERKPSLKAVK